MAFSDFKTIPEVQEIFKITHVQDDFVPDQGLKPSEHFLQEFGLKRQHIDVFASEGARCETLIFPILWEIYKGYTAEYSLWIRKSIAYDEILSGTPDYFVSTRSKLGIRVVGSPLIIIVEAKKNDFEQGWGQCLSELIAAQKINDDSVSPVYGIVTDGNRWEFGRLVGDAFTQNLTDFALADLPKLFGAIHAVFKAATEAPRKYG